MEDAAALSFLKNFELIIKLEQFLVSSYGGKFVGIVYNLVFVSP